jgi:hypothetical protein
MFDHDMDLAAAGKAAFRRGAGAGKGLLAHVRVQLSLPLVDASGAAPDWAKSTIFICLIYDCKKSVALLPT